MTLHGATTHHGQHNPAECFACKVKTLNFGKQNATQNGKDRWGSDPVVQRIEENYGFKADIDALNRPTRIA